MSITLIASPVLSPSLNQEGEAIFTDQNANAMAVEAVVLPDSSGHLNFGTAGLEAGKFSQVTGLPGELKVLAPGGFKLPVKALVGLDSAGNPIPFVPGLAAVATSAVAVSGKFQSAVTVATGSAQNVAHGLGVVPSLVLIAPYDNTAAGSTPFAFAIAEGAHDSTNVKLTATAGLKFKVIAFK